MYLTVYFAAVARALPDVTILDSELFWNLGSVRCDRAAKARIILRLTVTETARFRVVC